MNDLVSPIPTNGTLIWYLNDEIIPTPTLDIYNLTPGNYLLAYTFVHGDEPNCTFSDACSFIVTELIQPDFNSALAFCKGENIEISASSLNGFEGVWTSTFCPEPPCSLQGTNPSEFTASSTNLPLGVYTMQYAGLCLKTSTIDFEILGNPTVQWTPEDDTPCLNECFPFSEDILQNQSAFGWEYTTINDQGVLTGNEVCFPEINNPESVDICLWAALNHPVQDTIFTCRVEDCHEINPVFSPGNHPVLPEIACPGEILEIDVDYSLYDDCSFILNQNYTYDDCSSINIASDEYGSFPFDLFLFYQGCSDTLSGDIFIPEPPSAELEVTYDICIGDALTELISLRGDMLTFSWNVSDIPGNNYNFLLDDNNFESPIPNPIPFSDLNLYTDTTFLITATIENVCSSITLQDTVNYISKPNIAIDLDNVAGTKFCLPQDFYFEIGEFATDYIDSIQWTFQSIYDYGNIDAITYTNLQFPPPLIFTNNGVADTVVVTATAWNLCGSDTDSINFTLIPPDLYLEMPDYAEGLCPGESVSIPVSILEGDPFDGCEVTSEPIIPGLQYACQEDMESILVTIPASTPSGIYTLKTSVFGCGSSQDYTEIEVFPVPEIDFSMVETACTNTPITFDNQVTGATSFYWNFGEPASAENNKSELPFPIHSYALPGIYNVNLLAFTSVGCSAELSKSIEIFGPNPVIHLDNTIICSGDSIFSEFEDQEDVLSLEWEFLLPGADTLVYTVQNGVSNTFFNQGDSLQFWSVTLTMEDIHGCKASDHAQVIVLPQPFASFTHGDLDDCAQGVEVQMINQSTKGTSSSWNFDDPGSKANNVSFKRNPTHSFTRAGDYLISLSVQNTYGCYSETTKLLSCSKLSLYVPNAFTPDGNRINEIFKPVINGIHDIDFTVTNYYTFEVFDRWGQLVFSTHDPDKGWNGSSPDKDYYSAEDVYIWQVRIEFPTGAEKWQGHVTLVR